jgi:hypothetical protein
MKRRLLNLLTLLSLLLCVAVAALWVRSYWVSDAILIANGAGERGAQTVFGTGVLVTNNMPHGRARLRWDRFDGGLLSAWEDGSPRSLPNRLGFGYRFTRLAPAGTRVTTPDADVALPPIISTRKVMVPLWLPVALFALLPAARLYRRIRPRYAAGRCQACGYDLRATPGRCPECGSGREGHG